MATERSRSRRGPEPAAAVTRCVVVILDGVGAGELPDAASCGDAGADTLGNIARATGGLCLPTLGTLGLGNLLPLEGVPPEPHPRASYGLMAEAGPARDTSAGHWELMGLVVERPFPVYPRGFPPAVIGAFERAIGRAVLGNVPASGTEIIDRLGAEHLATGAPIVYTSADSVFQIAAHEEIIPPRELYRMCAAAREILSGEHAVGRVIARPFAGEAGRFRRTSRRRDFSLPPPGPTLPDLARAAGLEVWGVGKIEDIFAGRGITRAGHTSGNREGMALTLELMRELPRGLLLVNLADFDTLWGHRNDAAGFAAALEETDAWLPLLLEELRPGDLLALTADHGCDPTTPGSDHTREHVPLLVTAPGLRGGVDLGRRTSFGDLGVTLRDLLGIPGELSGTSFARLLR